MSANFEDSYPLSPMQQGMLFHSIYAPESGTYVTQVSCRLEEIDPVVLAAAWQKVVDRHGVLRTAFVWKKTEQPLQVVGRHVKLPIERKDWRGLDGAAQEEALRELLATDRARGFEPSRAPLMRLTLIQIGERSHRLLWSHHHLLLDGWSVPILLGEVFSFYAAFRAGREPDPPPPRPFGDYIRWLEGQDLAAAEAFWKRLLAGFVEPTPLPFDRSAAAGAEPRHEEEFLSLSREATLRLQELARRVQVTLNSIIQGAWAVLLSRSSGQRDVVYGATVSGRPESLDAAETMVGLLINTLPVRLGLPPRQPLIPWLQEVQERLAEVRDYEHTPLARIQAWSEVPRGSHLFDSILGFENYPVDESLGRGMALSRVRIDDYRTVESTSYPLCLAAGPGAALTLRILYDGARFTAPAVRRMLAHLEVLLGGMAERPQASLEDLPWLAAAERHQVLREWNDVPPAPVEERCIHELLAATAERRPDAAAIWFEGDELPFSEVERRANRLAHHLRRFGAGPDVPVGICAERSPDLIVGLLAILKAGGAFLPLDPELPSQRLAAMLEDARPAVIVVQDALAGSLPPAFPLVRLGADGPAIAAEPASPPAVQVGDRNLAYVLFTSGSTGRPKGVMIDHRGLRNGLLWKQTAIPLRPSDRVAQKIPFSFDPSVWETFGSLLAGSCLVIVRPDGHRDSRYLAELFTEQRVTFAIFVPSMLQVFLDEPRVGATLTQVICGGEVLSVPLQERFFRRFDAALYNVYGPTEASIGASWWTCERDGARSTVPIGRPVSHFRLHLLDAGFRPVPIGVAGELCIGGIGLARGYIRRPDLTADRYVPDPVGEEPGERLYRTGDLVRHLPDGCIEYIGRVDHQVKVRGFRIELPEIEGTLLRHPGVRAAAVVTLDLRPGDRRLVAYVVAGPPPVAEAELRRHLKQALPEYMMPSAFVFLEALPLLDNGKLDRRALPAPDRSRAGRDQDCLEARTDSEEALVVIWREVLGLDDVGVTDNFFELGGDSILCLQIVSRAHRRGLRLTPRQVFENPTIVGLLEVLDCAPPLEAEQGLVTGPVPLTPVQHWFFEQELAASHHFNQAVLLEAVEPLDEGLLRRAVDRLMVHHDALRMRYQRDESGWHQVNAAPGGPVPVVRLDFAGLDPTLVPRAVEAAAEQLQRSLDLTRGPLLRASLITRGPATPARLLILVHHLVVDGVSWRILLEDLQEVYSDLRRGGEPSLPAKSTSFRSWAHRLRDYAASEEVLGELDFWASPERAEVRPLPADHPDGEDVQGDARTVTASLDPVETKALLQVVPRAYQTQINDVLLTALALALAEWTGERRFLVDLERHGREEIFAEADLSRTVGWFTTLTPVLLDVAAAMGDPGAAIKAVKEQLRRVPARGIGYGALRSLSPRAEVRERLRTLPSPELVFNYLGQLDVTLDAQASLFLPVAERFGSLVDERGARSHRLQISGQVVHRQLHLVLIYGGKRYDAATAEQLMARFAAALGALIDHCGSEEAGGYTPSDFPDVDLSQDGLDQLLDEVEEIDALGEGSAA